MTVDLKSEQITGYKGELLNIMKRGRKNRER